MTLPEFTTLADQKPIGQAGPSYSNASVTAYQSHMPQEPLYQPQASSSSHPEQDAFRQQLHVPVQQHPTQGLTSLMEAALAPHTQQTFAFAPIGNDNPLIWDGFMPFNDSTGSYMGAYDADMSWTLDYLPTESSPGYLADQDMLNTYEGFDHQYGYQAQTQAQYNQASPVVEDADGDDDDASDWPDKVNQQQLCPRKASRVVPIQMKAVSWQSAFDEAQSGGLTPLTIPPPQGINFTLRESLLSTLNGGTFRGDGTHPEISDAIFPPVEILDFFMRLYVRYIQPRFPILHLPTFDIYTAPPSLLLAMMFLGSSHSRSDCGRFSRLFHERLRVYIIRLQEIDKDYVCNYQRSQNPANYS